MINGKELCHKILEIYPEIGTCGIDLDVQYDTGKESWMVDLIKNRHHLQTRLETDEPERCLVGKECVSLGIQVSQLVDNIGKL